MSLTLRRNADCCHSLKSWKIRHDVKKRRYSEKLLAKKTGLRWCTKHKYVFADKISKVLSEAQYRTSKKFSQHAYYCLIERYIKRFTAHFKRHCACATIENSKNIAWKLLRAFIGFSNRGVGHYHLSQSERYKLLHCTESFNALRQVLKLGLKPFILNWTRRFFLTNKNKIKATFGKSLFTSQSFLFIIWFLMLKKPLAWLELLGKSIRHIWSVVFQTFFVLEPVYLNCSF